MHYRYEGTGRGAPNPVLTARRAVEMTFGAIRPLQNQIGQFLVPPGSGLIQHPQLRSAPGGEADEIEGKADIAILNVCSWGLSRRSGGMSMTSVDSQEATFVMPCSLARR